MKKVKASALKNSDILILHTTIEGHNLQVENDGKSVRVHYNQLIAGMKKPENLFRTVTFKANEKVKIK